MITRELVSVFFRHDGISCAPVAREKAEEFMTGRQFIIGDEWRVLRPDEYEIRPVPTCQCCGSIATSSWSNGQARCDRHCVSNPCAIEGCRRTRRVSESGRYSSDGWLCSEHWRRFVPPRSLRRRAYNAFFRRAKRQGGWDDELARQFWGFWDQLIATARAKAAGGSINVSEINRLFGWAE